MMDIKEIAQIIRKKIYVEDGLLLSKFISEKFAETLIAELAKGNEPCAFLHEWIEYHPFGDTVVGEPCAAITSDEKPFDSSDTVSPLFTFPPTAEQIANETAWQPIETAPVLSNVLVTRFDYGQVCWVTDARKSKFGFWSTFNGRAVNEPTHWMPLPKAPNGASS